MLRLLQAIPIRFPVPMTYVPEFETDNAVLAKAGMFPIRLIITWLYG